MEGFLGEIRVFGAGVIPRGWLACEGQLLAISTNLALFSILGTTYGGDGVSIFKLPDLRGRVPISVSPQYQGGQAGGEETHTLTISEIPSHTHQVTAASATADQPSMANNVWASTMSFDVTPDTAMSAAAIGKSGANAPHSNMQPYLALNFCIAINGIYPSRP